MDNEHNDERRMAALCKSLGNLWSKDDIVDVKDGIFEEKLQECKLTLFMKLYSKPNVNFQAFLNTMKRAWKTKNVDCTLLEPEFFSFSFASEADKQRVLNSGPWLFSSNLLMLQQCHLNTPELCYEFTHCAFWVHFYGLPFGRVTREIVKDVASKIGKVMEGKLEAKGNSNYKVGKTRINLNLAAPLKTRIIINLGRKNV
ncbi:hypothetical protein EUGRSUZ_E01407 [Eucalyptus grandis]|uniref:Uncharacterized protein n=2 Tax=Eucalyptus grandis TaxID=71139 RepID=A0ACC3KU55_EUCGR|nr:hypothetical protein EUGRSUZ_E01407 [Eucalyptus grandis]